MTRRDDDELLDQHIEALKATAQAGPSQQLVAKTLEMLRAAESAGDVDTTSARRRRWFERLVAMTSMQRFAAAAMIVIAAGLLYLMFTMFATLGPSVAFADVAAKLRTVRTFAYTSTVTFPGKPPQTMRTLHASAGRIRSEAPDGAASISDGKTLLVLDPKARTATRLEFGNGPLPQVDFADGFRRLGTAKGEAIGEKKIDGVAARGFRATVGNMPMTIWADAKTALPVRVESALKTPTGDATVVMDHFEFDRPLDESLFSMDAPDGYAVVKQQLDLPKALTPDAIVADFLKAYADASGGTFPPNLNDPEALRDVIAKITDPQKRTAFTMRMGMLFGTVYALRDNYGYAGRDVKLGEKDKIVFWYKLGPAKTWKAIYGDLHVADVAPEQLPATQPSTRP